jgi:Skp family chaperone for outer membrane proteins
MKKNLYAYFSIACIAILTLVSSCKKTEEITTIDTDTVLESAQSDETVSDTFNDLFLISSQNVSLFDVPVTN